MKKRRQFPPNIMNVFEDEVSAILLAESDDASAAGGSPATTRNDSGRSVG